MFMELKRSWITGRMLSPLRSRKSAVKRLHLHPEVLDNRSIVLYKGTMKEKRTTQTVQKSIAAFFRENRRR
jgi:hypothetical protein